MARTSVTTQRITRAGLEPVLTAPVADGDIVDPGNVAVWVDNGSGASITVTAITPGTVSGLAVADLAVVVPAGESRLVGPLPASVFAQPADADPGANRVLVDYSAVASVTRAVVSF